MACPPCYSGCFSCLLSCFNPCYMTCTNAAQGSGTSTQQRSGATGASGGATGQVGYVGAQQLVGLLERCSVIIKDVMDSGNWKGAVGVMRAGTVGCISRMPRWMQCVCNCCYACASGHEEVSIEDLSNYLKMLEGKYHPTVIAAAYEWLLEEGVLHTVMEHGFASFSQTLRKACDELQLQMQMLQFTCKLKMQQEMERSGVDCIDGISSEFDFKSCCPDTICKTICLARNLLKN